MSLLGANAIREDLRRAGLMPDMGGDDGTPPVSEPRRGADTPEGEQFLREGGWRIVDPAHTWKSDSGMTAHRGVLQSGEYVDEAALLSAVQRILGFTAEEAREAYPPTGGPPSARTRGLRARLDARLADLAEAGHLNVDLLADVLGVTDRTLHRAIARGRRQAC